MGYLGARRYLDSFVNYEKISNPKPARFLKLDRLKFLLEQLGNPQTKFKSIHVAGTKAKGSTCAFIYSVLRQAGFSTGLYTSPHLVDFRERIIVNDKKINKKSICRLVNEIKRVIDNNKDRLAALTFFEIYTALTFLYFEKRHIDIAVVETGLGGRFDATNILKPLVCAITPISYDHTNILGNSLSSITREKAGIIKPNTPVVLAPQERQAIKTIKDFARRLNSPVYLIGSRLRFYIKRLSVRGSIFDIVGLSGHRYKNLKTSLIGRHQVINAAVAVGAIELLRQQGLDIKERDIKRGLKKAFWPGRLQVLRKRPLIVADGAHNEASALVLKEAIKKLFYFDRLFLILGISSNKNIKETAAPLCSLAEEVIFTKADNPRAAPPTMLKKRLEQYCKAAEISKNFKDAIKRARLKSKDKDLILVTGSLYLVGEAIRHLNGKILIR